MAKIQATIKDENTLALLQDGKAGDTIDLRELQEADFSHVSSTVRKTIDKEVEKAIEKEKARMAKENETALKSALLEQGKEIAEQNQSELEKLRDTIKDKDRDLQAEKQKLDIIAEKMGDKHKIDLNEKLSAQKNELGSTIKYLQQELSEAKDRNIRTNVKMLGETLEQHCECVFSQIQGFLPNAVFCKDNKAIKDEDETKGTKGDYIYRETHNGVEILTILFEMKNEGSTGKQKNADFFATLDKNRDKKGCEYAVLVSALEKDNPIYPEIYTVPSNLYQNMYVIRPQAFRTIIDLLRQAALKSADTKYQVALLQEQNIDYTELDKQFGIVRGKFGKLYETAEKKHNTAVAGLITMRDEINKLIDLFTGSTGKLLKAGEVLEEDLTVKQLAKNRPNILAQIGEVVKPKSKKQIS